MDRRRWSYDPHAPPDDERGGWSAAAREQDGRVRGQHNGHRYAGYDPDFDHQSRHAYPEYEERQTGLSARPVPPGYPPPAAPGPPARGDGYRPRPAARPPAALPPAAPPPAGPPPAGQPPAALPPGYRPDAYPPPAAAPRGQPAPGAYPPQGYPGGGGGWAEAAPPRHSRPAYPPERRPVSPQDSGTFPAARTDGSGRLVPGRDPQAPAGPGGGRRSRSNGDGPGGRAGPAPATGTYPANGTGTYPAVARGSGGAAATGGYPPAGRAGYPADRYPDSYPRPSRARHQPPPEPVAEPEVDDAAGGSGGATALWTISLFVVPVLLYLGWALTRSDVPDPTCVDATGAPCLSPQAEAFDQLVGVAPALAAALGLGLVISLGLRRVVADWHDFTVGLAGAVIGAGIATLAAAVLG